VPGDGGTGDQRSYEKMRLSFHRSRVYLIYSVNRERMLSVEYPT
jgi:hypothetical protein